MNAAAAILKDTTDVVNIENDVSRWAVKPIYPEDIDNVGSLTLNQGTSIPCGAVQAGHTVTDVEDNTPLFSELISSSHSENQLQTPNLNISSPTLELPEEVNPSKEDPDELSTPDNIDTTQERIYTMCGFNPSEEVDPTICYNKFLFFYRLQTLPQPQSIGTFLYYIRENYPHLYSNQYIRISLKQHPYYDTTYTEAHIYLPYESILPNHTFFIPLENLLPYYKLELRSTNNKSQPSHFFFQPPIPDNLFHSPSLSNISDNSFTTILSSQPTPIPTPSLDNSSISTPTTPPPNFSTTSPQSNIISTPRDLHLTIATHNVRGFNVASKRQIWQDYCINHDISIASITETKISQKTKLSFCNNHLYTYYWANSDSSMEGAAIMVRNHLKPHIHSCLTHPGGAIALDLFFKSNIKLRIISVYLSSTDSTRRNLTQNTVINWIIQAQQLNLQPIILGDFNTHDTHFSSSSKFKLINFLHRSNMFDVGAHFNNTHFTWSNNTTSSRIDYIWTNMFNTQFLLSYNLEDSKTSTLSDHLILSTSWTFPNAYSKPPRIHTNISRRIFDYKATSNNQWSEFSELTTQLIEQCHIPLSVNTSESIDTTWHKLQHCITQAAIKTLPNKLSRKRSYNHRYSPKCTALHLGLKKLGHLIRNINNNCNNQNSNLYLPHIHSHILVINSYTKCNLQSLTSLNPADIQLWLQHAYTIWKQVYHAYHLEHSLRLRQQINQASEKRCETLVSKPKQAINNILNRYQPPVHFTNIKMPNQLITDPTTIKQHIQAHFSNWTAYKPINQTIFNNHWQQQYQPLPHINPNWYTPLTLPITEDEVLQTISKLPNGKACGPTGISYEMIKHLSHQCITAITTLFNRCLSQNSVPKLWKHSRIYPIPKNNTFDGNLNLTRPISLIEHIRKIYTKIITNRLNQVFSQYPILSPFNYVALPGNSTSTPIHILNNLIEDANCNYKEIWLLSQDMSKAYDSVNFDLLKLSLQRLSLPQPIINILSDLLINRQNTVITNLGLTPPYQVQNGIDQGETITPLLWRIYYDPLIAHIHSTFSGYSTSTSWLTNLKSFSTNKLEANSSVLAYMDDTLWIASNQTELANILSVAESFYNMANIKVNPTKSILTSNAKPSTYYPITFNNETLPLWPANQPFKFLGCWFTLNNKQSKQTQLIFSESSQLIKIASTKQITDTQARYIINTVIIPTIEYRLQNITLSQSTCNKIFKQHINLVKHKAKLCRTIPTSILLHPHIYNIKHIWDIQLQHHIPNFIKRLNHESLLGISTQIRVQQLQNNLWSSTSILSHPNPIIDGPNRFTTNFKIIQLLKHINWSISPNPNTTIPFTIQEGSITLESILSIYPNYTTFKKQLRHHHILFLDQITTSNNACLLDWKHISPRINKIPKGKIPQWFKLIEDSTINSVDNRLISPSLNMSPTNYYSYNTGHFQKHAKPWLITLFNNQSIVGKARRQSTNTGHTLITHWYCNLPTNSPALYPIPNITTNPCPGCSLNSNLINNKCTILIPTSHATKFFGRFNPDKSINFNANPLDLIYSINLKNITSIPPSPNLIIHNSQIPPIFLSNPASDILQSIAYYNYYSTNLTFYTDGSVISSENLQCSMGIGWLLVNNNNILHTFQAQISLWPCSFKAELLAILSAICIAPRNCNIQIFTDSQSVISKYNNLTQQSTNPKYLNTPYWSIWNTLLNFIKSHNLTITFHKVKAHQNNIFNNKADELARNHLNAPHLIFNSYNIYNPLFTPTLENHPVELPTHRSIRTICHAHIFALWSSQNRFQPWIQISQYINWNSTWLYLNNNQKVSNFAHSFQSSTLKTFRVKLLTDELPTPHTLHKRNPLYPNTCHICQQTSTPLHWAICPSSNPLNTLIQNSIQQILTPAKLQISQTQTNQLYNQIINLDSLQIHYYSNKPSIFSTLSGLVPLDITHTIQEYTTSIQIANSISIQLLLSINKQLYSNIWIPYCSSRPQPQLIQPQNPLLPIIPSITNTSDILSQTLRSKLSLWQSNWIKYRTHPSHILNLIQI